uniref:Uncharacterized protein n=1 Tax=Anguilla anguilla TaxID=7936 RepID=A0A0E9PL66_ANGAN
MLWSFRNHCSVGTIIHLLILWSEARG